MVKRRTNQMNLKFFYVLFLIGFLRAADFPDVGFAAPPTVMRQARDKEPEIQVISTRKTKEKLDLTYHYLGIVLELLAKDNDQGAAGLISDWIAAGVPTLTTWQAVKNFMQYQHQVICRQSVDYDDLFLAIYGRDDLASVERIGDYKDLVPQIDMFFKNGWCLLLPRGSSGIMLGLDLDGWKVIKNNARFLSLNPESHPVNKLRAATNQLRSWSAQPWENMPIPEALQDYRSYISAPAQQTLWVHPVFILQNILKGTKPWVVAVWGHSNAGSDTARQEMCGTSAPAIADFLGQLSSSSINLKRLFIDTCFGANAINMQTLYRNNRYSYEIVYPYLTVGVVRSTVNWLSPKISQFIDNPLSDENKAFARSLGWRGDDAPTDDIRPGDSRVLAVQQRHFREHFIAGGRMLIRRSGADQFTIFAPYEEALNNKPWLPQGSDDSGGGRA